MIEFQAYGHFSSDAGKRVSGQLSELLLCVPYLLLPGVIPPCHVVNDVLRRGIVDAGMSGGCRWEPFQIDETEWEYERTELEAKAERYHYVEPAPWVKTYED